MGKGRRYLQGQALHEMPVPKENEIVALVTNTPGSNLLEVENEAGQKLFCRIPKRFRNLLWVKRGAYSTTKQQPHEIQLCALGDLVIASFDPHHPDTEVRGELSHTLYQAQIKHLLKENLIPQRFVAELSKRTEESQLNSAAERSPVNHANGEQVDEEEEESEEEAIERNHNRNQPMMPESESEEEEDE
eukprot:c4276_g1_i3.p1 GENE.c4276_g1_i3~~c4276_g1_i3.p1  ORF type:complete len:189 (+),score=33.65 c4276_g1_i3:50-616(+)